MKTSILLRSSFLLSSLELGSAAAASVTETDVIVVGAGPSGITSAYELHRAGLRTIVLEAKQAIGGRCRSIQRQSGPGIIELGATWINNKTQPQVYAMVEQLGLKVSIQHTEGDFVHEDRSKKIHRVNNTAFNTEDEEEAMLVFALYDYIETQAAMVDLQNYTAFGAERDVSAAEWLAMNETLNQSEHVKATWTSLTSQLVGREAREVGAHYILDYIRSGGSLSDLGGEDEDGAQYMKVKNGTTAIWEGLAATLNPGSVRLCSPVTAVTQCGDHYLVATAQGQIFQAKKVIMANPTNTYDDIAFVPPLPAAKQHIINGTLPGVYAKLIINYRDMWWRTAGLNGEFTSLNGPFCFSWDTSDEDLGQFSLAAFVAGDPARRWHALPDEETKKRAVVEHFAEIAAGVDPALKAKALDVLEVNMAEWTLETYLEGGPTSAMGPGALRQYGDSFRTPVGGVHFGGGETAYEWKGYLEGAVLAGQRVALEVINDLKQEGA